MPTQARESVRGMTLIELMVGITITGLLLAIGVPSFQSTIASSRLTSVNNELVSTLALARSEAIRRGTRVTVCKSTSGTSCITSGGWQQGWIVFVDTTRITTDASVDAGETIVSSNTDFPNELTLVGETAVANFISFAADGTTRSMIGAPQQGRLRVCSTSSSLVDSRRARDINVTVTGRVGTTTPASVGIACPLT